MDMLSLSMKAMGVDPEKLFGQAAALGETFAQLVAGQNAMRDQLGRIESQQLTIMAAMGLTVPPPTDEVMALIEDQSAKHVRTIEALSA